MRLEVLGLTFEQVFAAVRESAPVDEARVRRACSAAMNGAAVSVGDWTLDGRTLPISRLLTSGELIKFIQPTADGLEIESVVIPMVRNRGVTRTLCVSSQVGCAMGCRFCQTAQLGLLRSLSAAEIVGQIVAARSELHAPIRNVVFMGMGEPCDNLDNVIQAIRVLNDRNALSIGLDRITVSTVGRVAGIRRLMETGWRRLNLAVSLNAPNDAIRSQIMPINRAEPMAELRAVLLEWPRRKCCFVMLEYVLIPGVNDAREHALEVAAWARPIPSCINVIPYNPREDSPWEAPSGAAVEQFVGWIRETGQPVKRRVTKGRDLMAACGQLGNRALTRLGRPAAARAG